ncbi:MAG TPA: hypothetical protein VNO30_44485 [Kofleriaceae bacterium]|nr:hypothetical protein [Kofleriaceae bacterium]
MTRPISWIFASASFMLYACEGPEDAALARGAQATTVDAMSQSPLVIDDFTTGFDSLSLVAGHPPARLQIGSMLGGTREIDFIVNADALQQSSSYTINGAGGLVISSGLRSFWGVYLIYGYDVDHNFGSVDLDLSLYDRVCLAIGSNDQVVSGVVQFHKEGAWTTAPLHVEESSTPFLVSIPYGEFASATGEPLPWSGVFLVVVLLQVGSPNAGNDLELKALSLSLGACQS